jgi:hypothetical protein
VLNISGNVQSEKFYAQQLQGYERSNEKKQRKEEEFGG